ncbi:hypothetical protein M514_26078 [Trichuris suis]|uniref:Uncharacterized protein n=1 Tax=Trichuris suis TaxID=68888 RepID=A0A085MWY9_9BILA|nr:hypothetical protein M514_26078 [Trichuris suis]
MTGTPKQTASRKLLIPECVMNSTVFGCCIIGANGTQVSVLTCDLLATMFKSPLNCQIIRYCGKSSNAEENA